MLSLYPASHSGLQVPRQVQKETWSVEGEVDFKTQSIREQKEWEILCKCLISSTETMCPWRTKTGLSFLMTETLVLQQTSISQTTKKRLSAPTLH